MNFSLVCRRSWIAGSSVADEDADRRWLQAKLCPPRPVRLAYITSAAVLSSPFSLFPSSFFFLLSSSFFFFHSVISYTLLAWRISHHMWDASSSQNAPPWVFQFCWRSPARDDKQFSPTETFVLFSLAAGCHRITACPGCSTPP